MHNKHAVSNSDSSGSVLCLYVQLNSIKTHCSTAFNFLSLNVRIQVSRGPL